MLHIAETKIHMRQFRETIHTVLIELQNLAQELLFDWWPDIQLDRIQDNLAAHRLGFSFLSHPANRLQGAFRKLEKLAISEQGRFSFGTSAGRAKLREYLIKTDTFVRLFFTAMHITYGMPARGDEIKVVRWANTVAVQRNIFIYEAMIILIFAYNKANTNTNNSFYIVRSPCPLVQKLLYAALVVRPIAGWSLLSY
jgi:hypothetical protein